MSLNLDWNREITSWHERKNAESSNNRKHRHHECEDSDCYDIEACDRNVHRSFEVSLPITIIPYALPCEPDACCGGEVKIRHGHKRCDRRSKSHEYTISQIINVEIPIEFGAKICYEDYCSEEHDRCNDE